MLKVMPKVRALLVGGPEALVRRVVVRIVAAILPSHRTNGSGNNMSQR